MARNLTANFITEATATSNSPIAFFEGVFASSTVRLWTGYGDLSWNGQTWLGNGWFQGIEGAEESDRVEAFDMTIILMGVPSSVVSLALGDQKQGAAGKIWIGFLNGSSVVSDPYLWWQGKYSHGEIEEQPDTSTIRLFYESHLVDLQRPKEYRWNKQTQEIFFSGDTGFDFMKAAANYNGAWGAQKVKPTKDNKKRNRKPQGGHR